MRINAEVRTIASVPGCNGILTHDHLDIFCTRHDRSYSRSFTPAFEEPRSICDARRR